MASFIINLIGGDNYLVAMTIYSIAKHSREIERGALSEAWHDATTLVDRNGVKLV